MSHFLNLLKTKTKTKKHFLNLPCDIRLFNIDMDIAHIIYSDSENCNFLNFTYMYGHFLKATSISILGGNE